MNDQHEQHIEAAETGGTDITSKTAHRDVLAGHHDRSGLAVSVPCDRLHRLLVSARRALHAARPIRHLFGVFVAVAIVSVSVVSGSASVKADSNEGSPGVRRGAQSAISAGGEHTCARLASGAVKCWGSGSYGQLGQGNIKHLGDGPNEMGDNLARVELGTGRAATAVAAGASHTCALLDNGTVKCWGAGSEGKLGRGTTNQIGDELDEMGNNLLPVALGAGHTATAVTAGSNHTCALLDNGTVKCWGYGDYGQLGQGNRHNVGDGANEMGDNLLPVALGTGRTATAVTAGYWHTCALLDNGTVKCWGAANDGQLGQGNGDDIGDGANEMGDNLLPVALGTGRTARAVAAGDNHTCALLDDASVKCWGFGGNGQLGQGTTNDRGDEANEMGDNLLPVALGTGRFATAVTAGSSHTCALLDDATLKCWGSGAMGQLGLGNTNVVGDEANEMGDFLLPVNVGAGRTATAVTAGNFHTCALLDNAAVKCWGAAVYGQLGQGNTNQIGDGADEMGNNLTALGLGAGTLGLVVAVVVTPAAPTGLAGTAGSSSVSLSWTAPGDDGGAPVTGYRIEVSTDNSLNWATVVADTGSMATTRTISGLVPGQPVRFRVAAINDRGAGVASAPSEQLVPTTASPVEPPPANPQTPQTPHTAGYVPLTPARVLDTRPDGVTIDGLFQPGVELVGEQEISLQVTGRGGVPAGAAAVVLNVTVTETEDAGFITAYPCGTTRPNASNVNFIAGQTIPNNVIVAVGAAGTVCLFSSQTTHMIADVNGAFPTGSGYTSLIPARVLDTRRDGATIDGLFRSGVKLVGGEEISLQVAGRGGVPADAAAVVLNVTATEPEGAGFITAYPCGTTRPNASNVNFIAGQTIPNNVIVTLGATGTVCLFSSQTTHLIADVNGAFPTGSGYTSLIPARVLDTRPDGVTIDGLFQPGVELVGEQEISLRVTGRGGVPAGADAVVLNVTATETEGAGFIAAYPCGTTRPNASNVNFIAGQTIPNNVIVAVGAAGTVCLFSSQTTHLIADVNGAFP